MAYEILLILKEYDKVKEIYNYCNNEFKKILIGRLKMQYKYNENFRKVRKVALMKKNRYTDCAFVRYNSKEYECENNEKSYIHSLETFINRLHYDYKKKVYAVISISIDLKSETTYFITNELLYKAIRDAIRKYKNKGSFIAYEILLILKEYDKVKEIYNYCNNEFGKILIGRLRLYSFTDTLIPKYLTDNMKTLLDITTKYKLSEPILSRVKLMEELNKISISRGVLNGEVIKSASI